jgi:hypothetical protein
MSLDNIDEKFKKVAKGFSEKNKKVDPAQEMSVDSLQEKDKYEESFDKKPVSGLLSVFENHLRNKIKSTEETESDTEFRTVDLTTTEATTTENPVEKVTEEEIESLIKVTDKRTINTETKKNITIDNEVYSQKKYSDIHDTVENIATTSDLQINPEKITEASMPPTQTRYSDTKQTTENSASSIDLEHGLQPVNKIVKEADGSQNETKIVDPKVLEHIKSHRAKRDAERGNLPDNYQVESKN